jgi:cell division transport system permease protein
MSRRVCIAVVYRFLEHCLVEALTSAKRHWLMSIAATVSSALSVFVFGLLMLIVLYVRSAVLSEAEKVNCMRVYLRSDVSEKEARELEKRLQRWVLIKSVKFVHKDKGLKEMEEAMGNRISLQDLAGGNPLPHRLDVVAVSVEDAIECAKRLKRLPEVESVICMSDVIRQIAHIARIIRLGGLALVLITGFATLSLIANAIRLTIYARREAIRIMQLVGATLWFIRGPLILEGLLYGLFGGALASIAVYGVHIALLKLVETNKVLLMLFHVAVPSWHFFFSLSLFGLAFGLLGSLTATHQLVRHLA